MAEPAHFSIQIHAPKQHVYDVMLSKETYEQWTAAFQEGSTFEGSWEEGSEQTFTDGTGTGMLGKITENKPGERVVIEYSGIVGDGQRDTTSEEAQQWIGALEMYDFHEQDGVTTLNVTLEGDKVDPEMAAMMADAWPQALAKLKELAEQE